MCTLVLAYQVHPQYPLLVAANREEFFDRPTGACQILDADVGAVGGRDLRAGGTWMGVTRDGFFAALTNQRPETAVDEKRASRGALIMELLRQGRDSRSYVQSLHAQEYNPCNLVFGTAEGVHIAYIRDENPEPELVDLTPGVHVLPNGRLNDPAFPAVARATELYQEFAEEDWSGLSLGCQRLLADRTTPAVVPDRNLPFDADVIREISRICVRTPLFGTRSATIVALQKDEVAHYLYCEGPPDQHGFDERLDLFQ